VQRFFNGDESAEPSFAMADYYSILAKAVNALDPNTGMARQQLYQRARSAMMSELENAYPPFRRSEIGIAEIALESAIEKAEAEAVRRSLIWTANSDQGPPIQVPAPPANENDNFVAHASHQIGLDADSRNGNRPATSTRSPSGRSRAPR
jgi:hypothetical protein